MRVVIDTNVLISAALKDQSMPALAVHMVQRQGTFLKSPATEHQLFAVLDRPHFAALIAPATHIWLRNLFSAAELVTIIERVSACRDPTDDKFLDLAVNGRADIIVSGDADLLALNPFREIPILAPAEFVRTNAAKD